MINLSKAIFHFSKLSNAPFVGRLRDVNSSIAHHFLNKFQTNLTSTNLCFHMISCLHDWQFYATDSYYYRYFSSC